MPEKLLLLILLTLSVKLPAQDVSFYRENITMRIDSGKFFVSGLYYFESLTLDQKLLVYPFPTDSLYGKVSSVFMHDLTNDQPLEQLKSNSTDILFLVDFRQNKKVEVLISYQQELLGDRAEYILETTQAWKKPMAQATYQLIIPSDHYITRFSIPPMDSIITKQEKIYTWEMFEYLPSENIIFDFEIR